MYHHKIVKMLVYSIPFTYRTHTHTHSTLSPFTNPIIHTHTHIHTLVQTHAHTRTHTHAGPLSPTKTRQQQLTPPSFSTSSATSSASGVGGALGASSGVGGAGGGLGAGGAGGALGALWMAEFQTARQMSIEELNSWTGSKNRGPIKNPVRYV